MIITFGLYFALGFILWDIASELENLRNRVAALEEKP